MDVRAFISGWRRAAIVLLSPTSGSAPFTFLSYHLDRRLLIYPRFFLAVIEMRPLGFVLLFARNVLLLALVATLAVRVWPR